MGLVNSPAVWNRTVRRALNGLKNTDSFVDDLIVHTETWGDHIKCLRELFQSLRICQLTLKRSKGKVAFNVIENLGHLVGAGETVSPDGFLRKIRESFTTQN